MSWPQKLLIAAVLAWLVAGLSGWAEATYYNGITADGVIVESFFLPLTFIMLALGFCLAFSALLIKWFR